MKARHILHLPAYLRQMRHDIDKIFHHLEEINYLATTASGDTRKLNDAVQQLSDTTRVNNDRINSLMARSTELEHRIRGLGVANVAKSTPAPQHDASAVLFADNHDLDAFYVEFENRFRGTEAEIKQKQQPYIKLFEKAGISKKLPVADLGCGRGEFLELLTESGYKALGVDLNESMVARAKERGYEAELNDALGYLGSQKSESLAGITGFHLAEHIPFEDVLTLMSEAHRCLIKGGILLLETPNPESLFVGAFTFHYDPSHLKPLPPAIMQFAAQFKGFERAEIMRLQPELTPEEITKATKNETLQGALQRLYGPRDYALVAYK